MKNWKKGRYVDERPHPYHRHLMSVFVSFFLLAKLLSVRCAPVSERAKGMQRGKGKQKQETKNKPNPNTKQNPQTQKPEHNKRQIPLQQVRHVRRVRRSPHRTGETRGLWGPRARHLDNPRSRCQGSYGRENYLDWWANSGTRPTNQAKQTPTKNPNKTPRKKKPISQVRRRT